MHAGAPAAGSMADNAGKWALLAASGADDSGSGEEEAPGSMMVQQRPSASEVGGTNPWEALLGEPPGSPVETSDEEMEFPSIGEHGSRPTPVVPLGRLPGGAPADTAPRRGRKRKEERFLEDLRDGLRSGLARRRQPRARPEGVMGQGSAPPVPEDASRGSPSALVCAAVGATSPPPPPLSAAMFSLMQSRAIVPFVR